MKPSAEQAASDTREFNKQVCFNEQNKQQKAHKLIQNSTS